MYNYGADTPCDGVAGTGAVFTADFDTAVCIAVCETGDGELVVGDGCFCLCVGCKVFL